MTRLHNSKRSLRTGRHMATAPLVLIPLVAILTFVACGDDDQGAPLATNQLPIEEATIAELRTAMDARRVSAVGLVEHYLERIETLDRNGPTLRAVIEVNPDAPRAPGNSFPGLGLAPASAREATGP